MSKETVARWNAIPLAPVASSLKRPRPDDSDDDISIVSRTPSPSLDHMDVDGPNLYKYDEYVPGPAREVITVETPIKPSNKGFAMLTKLGWTEGQPLGVSGDGRLDPIPFHIKHDSTGLGKMNQDVRMIETTVSQRRGLDSERMTKETEDQRRAREDLVARRSALESEISTTLKAFYCELCDKQFRTVVAYTEHTNSYAHHHKARFKDMQANIRIPQDDVDKRKEKERKREEKELRKIAAANGIKMSKPSMPISALPASDLAGGSSPSMDLDGVPLSSGWASVSGTRSSEAQPAPKKSGWATVGSVSVSMPAPPLELSRPSEGWAPAPPLASTHGSSTYPAFRTAGWTSLDTGSSQSSPPPPDTAPPPPPLAAAPPPPPPDATPPPPPVDTSTPPPRRGGWSTLPPAEPNTSSPSRNVVHTPSSSVGTAEPPPLPPSLHVSATVDQPHAVPKANGGRSGWQQFQKSASSKRR